MSYGKKAVAGLATLGVVAAFASSTSCVNRKFSDGTKVRHEAGAFQAKSSIAQGWAEVSVEDHVKFITLIGAVGEGDTVLPSDSVVTKRLQYWADRVDAAYRKSRGAKADTIPKPRVVVVDSPNANAFVVPSVICTDAPVVARGVDTKGSAIEPGIIMLEGGFAIDGLQVHNDASKYCVKGGERFTPDKVVAYFEVFAPQCKLAFEGSRYVIEAACAPTLAAGAIAARMGFLATSNHITFYSNILKKLTSEAEVASVMAHELGHYYSGHATPLGIDSFVYQQADRNAKKRPTALRAYKWVYEDGKASEMAIMESGFWDESFTTTIPKSVAQVVANEGTLLHSGALGVPACSRAAGKRGALFSHGFDWSFSAQTPNVVRSVHYPDFEKDFVECIKALTLVISPRDAVGAKGSLAAATAALNGRYRNLLREPTVEGKKTVWDGVKDLDAQIARVKTRLGGARAELQSRKLGIYTSEQEADDFSVEMMAEMGLPPKSAINAYMDLVRLGAESERPPPFNEIFPKDDSEACGKRLEAGWREGGVPTFEPIGAFISSHHASCYRVFNAYRENETHGYPAGEPLKDGVAPGGAWADLLKLPLKGFAEAPAEGSGQHAARPGLVKCAHKASVLGLSMNVCL